MARPRRVRDQCAAMEVREERESPGGEEGVPLVRRGTLLIYLSCHSGQGTAPRRQKRHKFASEIGLLTNPFALSVAAGARTLPLVTSRR